MLYLFLNSCIVRILFGGGAGASDNKEGANVNWGDIRVRSPEQQHTRINLHHRLKRTDVDCSWQRRGQIKLSQKTEARFCKIKRGPGKEKLCLYR